MKRLIDVRKVLPDILLDIRYAGRDNAFQTAFYPFPAAFLRETTARKLVLAEAELRRQGKRLKILDAYRPLSVQKRMWQKRRDARYVADPARGSSHNRGAAVDVALTSLDGIELAMPSDFDVFGPSAAHDYPGASCEGRRNAEILKNAMTAAGFEPLPEEWWHYGDADLRGAAVLDISFDELAAL